MATATLVGCRKLVADVPPKIAWEELAIRCEECREQFSTLRFAGTVKFCPYCGSKMEFAKHAKKPRSQKYLISVLGS